MTPVVRVEHDGPVMVLTIDRPLARNAIDAAASELLGTALIDAATHDGIAAVVVTGAGGQAFCTGMDLKSFARTHALPLDAGIGAVLRDRYSKPLVAAVNGAAVGGGFDLVLACDLAVAAEGATFSLPEVRRGLASVGGATRLAQRVPPAVALELALTGEAIDARRAFELGLVNRVLPAEDVLPEAMRLARLIADSAPLAVAFTRALVHDVAGSLDAAAWSARQAGAEPVFRSDDARIGAAAFAARQQPSWTGR